MISSAIALGCPCRLPEPVAGTPRSGRSPPVNDVAGRAGTLGNSNRRRFAAYQTPNPAAASASMPPPVNAWNARALDATSAVIKQDRSNARPGVSSLSASSPRRPCRPAQRSSERIACMPLEAPPPGPRRMRVRVEARTRPGSPARHRPGASPRGPAGRLRSCALSQSAIGAPARPSPSPLKAQAPYCPRSPQGRLATLRMRRPRRRRPRRCRGRAAPAPWTPRPLRTPGFPGSRRGRPKAWFGGSATRLPTAAPGPPSGRHERRPPPAAWRRSYRPADKSVLPGNGNDSLEGEPRHVLTALNAAA